ncbi:MAG: glycosyltransferase family 2 protein [Planctomycetota bacterium]
MSGPGRSVNPPAARHPGSPPPVSKMTGDWATVTRELAAGLPRPPISVVILTYNESDNVGPCIDSCAWSDDIHVLDSGSTDNTQAIARDRGASVHENPFESFGQQRNWAIDNIHTKHDWQLQLDADERCTVGMVREMHDRVPTDDADAFRCPSMLVFMDRWLRFVSEYPVYQVRLFNTHKCRFADHGHGQREDLEGPVGSLAMPYAHHNFSKGLDDWFDKHNRYSALEARQRLEHPSGSVLSLLGWLRDKDAVERRRALKALSLKLPMRPTIGMLYTLVLKQGLRDGKAGITYARMRAVYDAMTDIKSAAGSVS